MSVRSSRSTLSTVLAAVVALSCALGVALVGSVIGASSASAHAELTKITPYAGARLTTAPTEVVLQFNEPVSASFANVVVTTAAGVGVARGKPAVAGTKVTQALSPGLTSGRFRIAFRVVSDDGHQVTGESTFTLALTPATAATTASTPGASTTPSPSSAPTSSSTSIPLPAPAPSSAATDSPADAASTNGPGGWWILVAGVVSVLVVGAGVLAWRRQRR